MEHIEIPSAHKLGAIVWVIVQDTKLIGKVLGTLNQKVWVLILTASTMLWLLTAKTIR
jgi:hypothetical protein